MGLSAKAAMLICLGFTGGMTWLVNRVARPMVEMPSPLIVRAEPPAGRAPAVAGRASPTNRPVQGVEVAGRFERPSAVEQRLMDVGAADDTLALAKTREPLVESERVFLPPLHLPPLPPQATISPEAPTRVRLASAEQVTTELLRPETLASDKGSGEPSESPELAAVPDEPSAKPKRYRVRENDSLTKIARREWGSVDSNHLLALLEANPWLKDDPDHIVVGEELTIPDLASAKEGHAAAARRPTIKLVSDSRARADSRRVAKTTKVRWYTIRKRDCLASIARRYLNDHRRWREIAELNDLRNADRIIPGTRIKLPPAAGGDGSLST